MIRTVLALCLLGLLAAAPATARPASSNWWFWLSKPERHGSRKMPGDFRPVYTTYRLHTHERALRHTMPGEFKPVTASYRYHSRERRGLFSFLRRRPGTTARHRKGRQSGTGGSRKSHMTM